MASRLRYMATPSQLNRITGMAAVVAGEFVGPVAQQRRSHGVGEDERGSIDQKVCGAGGRRGERGPARFGKDCHTREG